MKHFLLPLLLLLLISATALAQEPVLSWGPAIEKDPHTLQNMHVVGTTDGQSFYAVYAEEGQAMLERYDGNNQRVWATAILPKTPSNQASAFYDVVILQKKLYLLSTFRAKNTTTVYAQEITSSGNYEANIQPILDVQGNGKLHVALSDDKNALLVTLAEGSNNTTKIRLLNADLQPRWSQTITSQGSVHQTLLQNNGTAFILLNAPSTANSPFVLYRVSAQGGKPEQLSITDEQYRLTQAKMASTPAQGLIVAGYYAPAAEATEQNPEPKGTFYFHFGNDAASKPTVSTYTPFNAIFLREYKRFKPDTDKLQMMRNLQLRQVLPLASGGAILIGEIFYFDVTAPSRFFHNDDIIVVRLNNEGGAVYATSANKSQSSANDKDSVSSYLATNVGETLHLLYLDFEYNYTADNKIIMAGPGSINKGPVLVSIPPSGKPVKVSPLHQSQTGRAAGLYLRPTSAYPISNKEIIVLGIGKDFYKYGRIKLD